MNTLKDVKGANSLIHLRLVPFLNLIVVKNNS